MSLVSDYNCNGCGVLKGKNTGWMIIVPYSTPKSAFTVFPLTNGEKDGEHYCGPNCAMKRISQLLDQIGK